MDSLRARAIRSVLTLTILASATTTVLSLNRSEPQDGQTPSSISRIVVDTDSTVTLTVNGVSVGELLEGQVRTLDVVPGDQVVQFRTPDGLVNDKITTTVTRGEQRRVEILIRRRLFAARSETARSRFETALDTFDRDVRVELQQAFERLREMGLASTDDEERLERALIGSVSDWMSSTEFQAEFDRRKAQGLFAAHTEGRNNAGQSQFRAFFRALPDNLAGWECRHGMSKTGYEQRHGLLVGQGFRRVSLQTFTDAAGLVRYQVTWLKSR